MATFSLAIVTSAGDYEFLLNKDVNFIREAYPNPTTTGTPAHYAQFDDTTFILGPTPDATYTAELLGNGCVFGFLFFTAFQNPFW